MVKNCCLVSSTALKKAEKMVFVAGNTDCLTYVDIMIAMR